MTLSQQPRQFSKPDPAQVAFERRRRAAWLDYLRSTREAAAREYEQVETNAWEQLQRRLRRNVELLTSTAGPARG
jgi:hypothetical protein